MIMSNRPSPIGKQTVKSTFRSTKLKALALALAAGAATLAVDANDAQAQEIQLTGPLAGAPAVRRLRLHREERFDIAAHATFTLLDEFRRTIMPGLRLNYHFFDWFGIGVFGGPAFSYNTSLSDELQEKAINGRSCQANPNSLACRRSAVSLCRDGEDCLADKQLGRMVWFLAPQLTFVPFRGKFSLFGEAFMDADISLFVGAGIAGVNERVDCAAGSCPDNFELAHRVTAGPTFGLGFNFYPLDFMGFGAEFRSTPFAWNTSGFDTAGGGPDENFPDDAVDGADSSLHFNPMLSVYISFQLPAEINLSD
jgi:outer membrane beta-barrel protein